MTWFKNENTKISTSNSILIEDHKQNLVLKIENLSLNDFGKYNCKTVNSLYTTEETTRLSCFNVKTKLL